VSAENAPPKWRAPETSIAAKRQTQTNSNPWHQLALARASALAIVTSATATGVFPPTEAVLNATSGLAASLYWDLHWADVAA